MASNYTTNYELPLWEPGDDFVRTEFNDAHEKIDGAIWAASRVVKLADVTLTEASDAITLSLAGVDLADYCKLELWVPKVAASSSGSVQVRLNDIDDQVYWRQGYGNNTAGKSSYATSFGLYNAGSGQGHMGAGYMTINLFASQLCGTSEHPYASYYDGEYRCTPQPVAWGIHHNYVTRDTLTKLTLANSGASLLAGSRAILLGIRI